MTSTTVGELVELLHEDAHFVAEARGCRSDETAPHKAADLISSLQKEIDAWREAAREFRLGEPTARQQLLDALAKAEGAA